MKIRIRDFNIRSFQEKFKINSQISINSNTPIFANQFYDKESQIKDSDQETTWIPFPAKEFQLGSENPIAFAEE